MPSFERDLRRLKIGEGEDALTGELLPYALHFALVSRDEVPLARFAQDWGRAFADLPRGLDRVTGYLAAEARCWRRGTHRLRSGK